MPAAPAAQLKHRPDRTPILEFETNERVSAQFTENKGQKEVARPERLELPTFCFVDSCE